MKRLRGVTLIELLVVIAVGTLLTTIIVPALKSVKEKACLIKCASNQHQIIVAASTYATENNSRLPAPVTITGTPNVLWRNSDINAGRRVSDAYSSLGDYLVSSEIYNCPLSNFANDERFLGGSTYQQHYTNPYNSNLSELYCSYQLLWNFDSFDPSLTAGLEDSIPRVFMGASIQSRNRLLLCETMSFTDSDPGTGSGLENDCWAAPHRFEGAAKKSSSGFPFYFRQGTSVDEIDTDASLRQIRLNAGYIDGRVEKYVAADTYKAQVHARQATMLIPKKWK